MGRLAGPCINLSLYKEFTMRGTVLMYDEATHSGKISGHDGKRYSFTRSDWTDKKLPRNGMDVDFDVSGNDAKDLIVIEKPVSSSKDKNVAGLLALFLGGIGVHHFYLGNAGRGILYLLFFWTFIPAIIALIEAIIFFTQDQARFAAKYS